MNILDSSKRERYRRIGIKIKRNSLLKANVDAEAKAHVKHKPYKCDFGGVKNE